MDELGVVDADPAQVRGRLEAALLVVRSVWFPTVTEQRAWTASTAPLYVRWRGPDALEVGPRLYSMAAARWAPMWAGRLVGDGSGRTRFVGRVRFAPLAQGLLAGWTLVLLAWLAAELQRGGALHWLPWWLALAALTASTAVLAAVPGGRALRAALPDLLRLAADPEAGADDWS